MKEVLGSATTRDADVVYVRSQIATFFPAAENFKIVFPRARLYKSRSLKKNYFVCR